MAVVIHGRAAIRPEMLEETRSAAIRMGEASRAEPGCNEYRFATDLADPAVMVLAEEWASEGALQAHMATPHFTSFSELLARAIAAPPDFRRFDAQDACPLFG
jgi:quinol monooxygenase YgiN